MIYLRDSLTIVHSFDGHISSRQNVSGYSYHIPYSAINFAASLGLEFQEKVITYWGARGDFNFDDIVAISTDNSTWQTAYYMKDLSWESVTTGFKTGFLITYILTPLRLGTSHVSGDKWGLTSTTLANVGNHTAYAKLVYYAPRYYFPLLQSLVDFAGSSIDLLNASTKIYGGVNYSANTPIFDEGLVITSNDVTSLDISNYTSGTILLKIRYKGQNFGNPRTILKTPDFELQLDRIQQTISLIKGGNILSVNYVNDAYENGRTYFIGIKWNATNTYLAAAQWDNINLTFEEDSLQTTSGAFTITFGDSYLGSNGTSQWLGDSISDFTLYDYEVF